MREEVADAICLLLKAHLLRDQVLRGKANDLILQVNVDAHDCNTTHSKVYKAMQDLALMVKMQCKLT